MHTKSGSALYTGLYLYDKTKIMQHFPAAYNQITDVCTLFTEMSQEQKSLGISSMYLPYTCHSYTKRTLSIQSVFPGEPTNAPPWLEAKCNMTWVGVSFLSAQPVSFMGTLSPLELRA